MIVYLVRHGRAGHRAEWNGDDRLRPLDERGRAQAEALVAQLDGREVGRIVSSPYRRCVETVLPLAMARDLELEVDDALAEGAGGNSALELFRATVEPLVACVHGDLVEELLGRKEKKGSTTVLDVTAAGLDIFARLPPQP